MNDASSQFGGLVQQSFLKQVRQLKAQAQQQMNLIDEEEMVYSVDRRFYEEQIQSLREQIQAFEVQQQECGTRLLEVEKKKLSGALRLRFLRDLEGLLNGERFVEKGTSSEFFCVSEADFANAHGIGEMSLQERMKASEDGFRIVLDGESYCFVRGRNGEGYFHEHALSDDQTKKLFGDLFAEPSGI